MNSDSLLPAGVEPGLRFAIVLDGRGGGHELAGWDQLIRWRPDDGFLWVHLEQDTPEAKGWLLGGSGLDPLITEVLLAEDSRPRVEDVDGALLAVLRGVNLCETEEIELEPLHLWLDAGRAVTLRHRSHALSALRDIRIDLNKGRGVRTPGELFGRLAEKLIRDVEPGLDKMHETIERLEDDLLVKASPELRRTLADLRRQAIHLRRYLGPQREALTAPVLRDTTLLDERDRLHLAGVVDRVARCVEDLDAFRDRATILYQDLAAQIQEGIGKSTYRFTVVASVILPPSLIAGLLGVNIGGIPGTDDPYAFAILVALILFVVFAQWWFLKRGNWV
ncbi:MAG: zinc transporter ZntB [Rhodospirillales bacterium]|nr:zinc transporter ZntB [Rhodospirillales bacterium]